MDAEIKRQTEEAFSADITGGDADLELWLLIAFTRHAMEQSSAAEFSPYNVTPGQANVLRIIYELGSEATFTEIAKRTNRAIHTISARTIRMEQKGLVKKIRSVPGSTLMNFELTPEGLEVYKQTNKRESMKKILAVLSDKEREQLTHSLKKLFNEAQKHYNHMIV
ncbi:MAG: MarR family transcriptional regulator [Nitrospira sp.]|nr:MarR family transcriptional regulator [Nitrospira sp.]